MIGWPLLHEMEPITGKSIEIDRRSWAQGLLEVSALSVVVFLMLVGSVAAHTKATKEVLTHNTTASFLYLGTITATVPSLLPLVFLPALSGFFIFRVAGITLDALLVNQPDGPEPFTDYR
ncbi:TPA: hypothetical protein ACYU63_003728 [Klebsiella variicola subsp. variicola]